jgi:uracil-DNA glycosylase family 4
VDASPLSLELEEIASKIRICTLCPLSKSRTMAVPGEGPVDAKLMFVGEAPGAEEDKQGRPFVGAAGKHLNSLLTLIELNREEIFITNTVKCRPPENRVPTWDERNACSHYLKGQIKIINPTLICTLGNTALETLTGVTSISRVHGQIIKKENILIFPLYHPAAALHNPKLKSVLESDMQKLNQALKQLQPQSTTPKHSDSKLDDFMP